MTRQSSKIQSLPVEILVEILSNLDNRTLLATQRVSGRWRDIVTTAPTLQQKLFLGPIATHNSNNLVTSNPLLESIFPPYLRQLAPGPGFSVLKNYFYYPYYPYEFKVRIPTRRESGRAVAVNAEVLNRLSAISYKKREVQAGKAASLEWFRSRAEAFLSSGGELETDVCCAAAGEAVSGQREVLRPLSTADCSATAVRLEG
jgi:hypothetical protein